MKIPSDVRRAARDGLLRTTTAGMAPGFAQANLAVVTRDWAGEFREFCERNPQPCPLLDVTEPGSPRPMRLAPDADIRYDLPGYRIFRDGSFTDATDLASVWTNDMVAFLIGCSFSFEDAMLRDRIPVRHIELGRTVPMFVTNIDCTPVGRLSGPTVVSMRPIPLGSVDRVREICARYPGSHGAPLHIGDPSAIGIADVGRPDFGDAVPIGPDEVPVFWACGVTPQIVLDRSGCPTWASHKPGCMFVSDREETIDRLRATTA
ncbi:MAG: hypothetical protein QOH08_1375 [Chloroflexota bacterium]|nr:hypothetical protein [Chloroflexota bacterium]